jgi:hypothetical protein
MFVQRILPAILVVTPAAIVATMQGSKSEPAAEQCKTKPGLSEAKGTHWYYRLDHVHNRRCWYLGLASAGQRANATTSEESAIASAPTVPPHKPVAAEVVRSLLGQATSIQPPELASTTAVPHVELAVRDQENATNFATRWSDLPKLEDLSSGVVQSADLSGLSGMSRSYADESVDEEVPQIPLKWPLVEAVSAQPDSSMTIAVQLAFLAGGAAMALVFMAGWTFRHIRGRRIYVLPASAEAIGEQPRKGGQVGAIENSSPASRARPAVRRRPTPTDPARDLKTSLGELMQDLQRAGAAVEAPAPPIRKPKRRTAMAQKVLLMEGVD